MDGYINVYIYIVRELRGGGINVCVCTCVCNGMSWSVCVCVCYSSSYRLRFEMAANNGRDLGIICIGDISHEQLRWTDRLRGEKWIEGFNF